MDMDWREMLKQHLDDARDTVSKTEFNRNFDKSMDASIARLSALLGIQDEPGFDDFIAEVKAMLAPKLGDTVYRYTRSSKFYPGKIVSFDRGCAVFEDDGRAPVAELRWSNARERWEYLP